MARSVNKVVLLGNLGRDAETKFTPSGVACTKFSVATERSWKEKGSDEWKKATEWSNVVLWRSEKLAEYLKKGTKVYLEGRLQTRKYENRDGNTAYATEVIAEEVILLGGNESRDSGGRSDETVSRPRSSTPPPSSQQEPPFEGGDDDVPF